VQQESAPIVDSAGDKRTRKDAIRSDNEERAARPHRENGNAQAPRRDARPDRTEQNRRQREQDDDGTVGFGDDVPAFMKVIAKV
jgi:hypothetical protein